MNTEGNFDVPDSNPRSGGNSDGGADDDTGGGDFDLSGFADQTFKPGAGKPSGERKPSKEPAAPGAKRPGAAGAAGAKGPGAPGGKRPVAPGKGPRAGESRGFDRPERNFSSPRTGGFREGGGSREGGAPRGPGGPREGAGPGRPAGKRDFAPREGGGPREGGFRKQDFPDRRGWDAASPRSGSYKPRFADRNPRSADRNPRAVDRGAGDAQRPFKPRGPGGDRPMGPRGADAPRRFGPRPPVVEAAASSSFKPVSAEVKPWLSLKQDKGRWKESRFLLEGAKNIADALTASPAMLHMAFATPDFKDKDLLALLKKNRVSVVPVSEDDIRALSDTETPQGIVAVCNFATLRTDWNLARYVTVLDGVQDPGNVGAIFRSSAALGMDAIVLGKGSCDPYNPKVVRSSVGALLSMPFETGEELGSKIGFLRQKGFSVVATSSHAKQTLEQAKLRKKVALIVGNEGAGTGASYLDLADAVVKIPLKSKVESLNVAVAHGILSYQLIHGRE